MYIFIILLQFFKKDKNHRLTKNNGSIDFTWQEASSACCTGVFFPGVWVQCSDCRHNYSSMIPSTMHLPWVIHHSILLQVYGLPLNSTLMFGILSYAKKYIQKITLKTRGSLLTTGDFRNASSHPSRGFTWQSKKTTTSPAAASPPVFLAAINPIVFSCLQKTQRICEAKQDVSIKALWNGSWYYHPKPPLFEGKSLQ